MSKQPTVREINSHLGSFSTQCYVRGEGWSMRISRARTRKGIVEGRVVITCDFVNTFDREPRYWEPIPADATVELS